MVNAGYIIIKDSEKAEKKAEPKPTNFRAFYGPLDKGSAKPSFCYPKLKEKLQEEIQGMKDSLNDGFVAENRRLQVKDTILQKEKRLKGLKEQEAAAMDLFKKNKDTIVARREELAKEIAEKTPSVRDVEKRRVNPYRIHDDEKKRGLGEKKLEFQVLSRLMDEESNVKFLQRD